MPIRTYVNGGGGGGSALAAEPLPDLPLADGVSQWNCNSLDALHRRVRSGKSQVEVPLQQALFKTLDILGLRSQIAQGINAPLTSVSKMRENKEYRVYLLVKGHKGVGILKIGTKKLFVTHPSTRSLVEVDPPSVLDFYVSEEHQRQGYGKELYVGMLRSEGISQPEMLAIDRPSPKFLSFMRKHYHLDAFTPEVNNFVVFHRFFDGTTVTERGQLRRAKPHAPQPLPPSKSSTAPLGSRASGDRQQQQIEFPRGGGGRSAAYNNRHNLYNDNDKNDGKDEYNVHYLKGNPGVSSASLNELAVPVRGNAEEEEEEAVIPTYEDNLKLGRDGGGGVFKAMHHEDIELKDKEQEKSKKEMKMNDYEEQKQRLEELRERIHAKKKELGIGEEDYRPRRDDEPLQEGEGEEQSNEDPDNMMGQLWKRLQKSRATRQAKSDEIHELLQRSPPSSILRQRDDNPHAYDDTTLHDPVEEAEGRSKYERLAASLLQGMRERGESQQTALERVLSESNTVDEAAAPRSALEQRLQAERARLEEMDRQPQDLAPSSAFYAEEPSPYPLLHGAMGGVPINPPPYASPIPLHPAEKLQEKENGSAAYIRYGPREVTPTHPPLSQQPALSLQPSSLAQPFAEEEHPSFFPPNEPSTFPSFKRSDAPSGGPHPPGLFHDTLPPQTIMNDNEKNYNNNDRAMLPIADPYDTLPLPPQTYLHNGRSGVLAPYATEQDNTHAPGRGNFVSSPRLLSRIRDEEDYPGAGLHIPLQLPGPHQPLPPRLHTAEELNGGTSGIPHHEVDESNIILGGSGNKQQPREKGTRLPPRGSTPNDSSSPFPHLHQLAPPPPRPLNSVVDGIQNGYYSVPMEEVKESNILLGGKGGKQRSRERGARHTLPTVTYVNNSPPQDEGTNSIRRSNADGVTVVVAPEEKIQLQRRAESVAPSTWKENPTSTAAVRMYPQRAEEALKRYRQKHAPTLTRAAAGGVTSSEISSTEAPAPALEPTEPEVPLVLLDYHGKWNTSAGEQLHANGLSYMDLLQEKARDTQRALLQHRDPAYERAAKTLLDPAAPGAVRVPSPVLKHFTPTFLNRRSKKSKAERRALWDPSSPQNQAPTTVPFALRHGLLRHRMGEGPRQTGVPLAWANALSAPLPPLASEDPWNRLAENRLHNRFPSRPPWSAVGIDPTRGTNVALLRPAAAPPPSVFPASPSEASHGLWGRAAVVGTPATGYERGDGLRRLANPPHPLTVGLSPAPGQLYKASSPLVSSVPYNILGNIN